MHTARNAGGVLALLGELGYDVAMAASGLRAFAGVKRRLETRAKVAGVTIIDSYAHHPTEVAADLRAVTTGGWERIWVVFQPHLYSRTEALAGSSVDRSPVQIMLSSQTSTAPRRLRCQA